MRSLEEVHYLRTHGLRCSYGLCKNASLNTHTPIVAMHLKDNRANEILSAIRGSLTVDGDKEDITEADITE